MKVLPEEGLPEDDMFGAECNSEVAVHMPSSSPSFPVAKRGRSLPSSGDEIGSVDEEEERRHAKRLKSKGNGKIKGKSKGKGKNKKPMPRVY